MHRFLLPSLLALSTLSIAGCPRNTDECVGSGSLYVENLTAGPLTASFRDSYDTASSDQVDIAAGATELLASDSEFGYEPPPSEIIADLEIVADLGGVYRQDPIDNEAWTDDVEGDSPSCKSHTYTLTITEDMLIIP